MSRSYQLEEYIDFLDKHSDYFILKKQHFGTVRYKEIIHFMDIAFPEWTSNAGIGTWAAEFVLTGIQNLECIGEEEQTSSEMLKDIYVELAEDYKSFKVFYQFHNHNTILDEFDKKYGEYLEGKEHLPTNDFNALYNELYKTFKSEYLRKRPYTFSEND